MDTSILRGVVFDLDGTLYEPPWLMKPRVALMLWRDVSILRHVVGARDWLRRREYDGREALLDAFYSELGRRAGLGAASAGEWYERRFIGAFLHVLGRQARARPGLTSLLHGLRERGVRTGVLSDYGRVAERIESLRIPVTLFDDLCSAEDSGALKPSPRPFLMCARNLGLEPARVLVVGDRDDMDGKGARAASMPFLCLGRRGAARRPGLRSWEGVTALLGSLAAEP